MATATLLITCALASCGSDDSPPAKCNALVAKVCAKAITCFQDGTTQAECVADANANLPCASADAIGATYGACMSDVDATSCAVLTAGGTLNLPNSCNAVILFN